MRTRSAKRRAEAYPAELPYEQYSPQARRTIILGSFTHFPWAPLEDLRTDVRLAFACGVLTWPPRGHPVLLADALERGPLGWASVMWACSEHVYDDNVFNVWEDMQL